MPEHSQARADALAPDLALLEPSVRTALLIGTAQTIGQAWRVLSAAGADLHVVGSLLVQPEPDQPPAPQRLEHKPLLFTEARSEPGATGTGPRGRQPDAPITSAPPACLGSLDALERALEEHRPTLAVVCLPTSMTRTIACVRRKLRELGLAERFLPPIGELLATPPPFTIGVAGERTSASHQPPSVDPAELLARNQRPLDTDALASIITGKRVLITGAGGSIGSQIARIVARFEPQMLVLMERAENALFEIDRYFAERAPSIPRRAVLNDVADRELTLHHASQLRPELIFHAAAHKHVPLMEDHPAHAITNNVLGTASIADAAVEVGCGRFVLISSDKAVNPTSVMGATKRLAEMYIQGLHAGLHGGPLTAAAMRPHDDHPTRLVPARMSPTRMSMVRFGNVLGSACSVLQIWSAQLADGGPLTVTDPRMTRYFMTIPEAAALVIRSAGLTGQSPAQALVHVLDMGQPVRILDLVCRFLRAAGFAAAVDGVPADTSPHAAALPTIEIRTTGMRPGEKLSEELALTREQLQPTEADGILSFLPQPVSAAWARQMHDAMDQARRWRDPARVVQAIRAHVPEMRRAA